jgi:hypothetical protein
MSITDEQFYAAVRKVAAEAPNTVYRSTVPDHQHSGTMCYYVHTDTSGNPVSAGCLIGKALHALGTPLETLALHEGKAAGSLLSDLGVGSDDAQSWARAVQYRQDSGATWVEAAAIATPEATK